MFQEKSGGHTVMIFIYKGHCGNVMFVKGRR